MDKSRRDFLQTVSTTFVLAAGASATATAADCSNVPAWDSSVGYSGGDQVTDDGQLWTAEWWTQGTEPAESENVWTLEGDCGTGGGSDGGDDSDGGDGIDCSGVAAYDPSATYTGGDQVTYEGSLWTAGWWTSGTEPAESEDVWTLEGDCGGDGGTGNSDPTASLSASSTSVDTGATVDFDGSGSTDSDGSIESYNWEFGDDASATGQTASHSYGSSGDYTVTLTVTDDDGATDTATTVVSVGSDSGDSGGREDDIFTPYLGTWGDILGDTRDASTDRVVLSFVGDGSDDGTVNPGWLTSDGDRPLSDHAEKISTLQDEGYDVWVAMGGWDGRIVARDASDVSEVKSAYETVLDTLGVTHIDIDDENYDEAGRDGTYYEMRNEALAQIQSERPDVKVSYTVAASPDGIVNAPHCPGKDMIADALDRGVDLSYINIMTMDWTDVDTTPARVKSAVQGTVDWMANVYPDMSEAERYERLGFLPNVDEPEWAVSDSEEIQAFAEERDVGNLSMWALHRDTSDYGHSAALYPFEDDEN